MQTDNTTELIDSRITIDEIILVVSNLLREARRDNFNVTHSLNDTKAEAEAQNLINKLKSHANR